MKNAKILLALAAFIFSISNLNAAGLNSVFSKDGINVWAVGVNGYVIYSGNAGVSWSDASMGNITYNSVFSVNQNIWITGNSGILQLTTDNGYSWNQLTLAGGANLKSVFFINSSTGWIAGNNGTILKSTNSGLNWTAQTSPVNNNLNCITFTDNNTGIACGVNGTVIITTNGGSNWILSTTPQTKELLSVDMKAGTIIASGANANVIKSTNNGASWNKIDYKILTKVDVNSVFMTDQNTYYSCGSDGFIRKSTDGGATFTYQANPMLADLHKIYFYNSNIGWAAGNDNNVVLRTTNGGNNWQMPAGASQSFTWAFRLATDSAGTWGSIFSLSSLNPDEIFLCANLHVYRSLNYGQSFQPISSMIPWGNTPHSLVISPKDSTRILAAYDSLQTSPPYVFHGKIYRTTDYGNTWSATFIQDIDPDSNPLAIDSDHPDTVYLGTTDSLVFLSTDFGLTWAPTGPSHLGKICSIIVVKGHPNILLCGSAHSSDSAYVYRSTDYGITWNVVYTSTGLGPEIPCLTSCVLTPDTYYFTSFLSGSGNSGGVFISTNDGLTWIRNNADPGAWGLSVANDDPNVIIFGNGGGTTAILTTNGGGNWTSLPDIPGFANQSLLCFNRKVILTQQNRFVFQLIPYNNTPIGIQPISTEIPKQFSLHQNYPNPFNPSTNIGFRIARFGFAKLTVYDILGKEIAVILNENLKPGVYKVSWDASNYPSGVYFYKLVVEPSDHLERSDGYVESKKMILLK
jgi:photosystem II stability/assembly factor-like uncharacterized protein